MNQFGSDDSLFSPIGIAVDSSNNVYVSDFLSGSIHKFTAPHTRTTFVSGVQFPVDLAFDPMDNLYVAQYS